MGGPSPRRLATGEAEPSRVTAVADAMAAALLDVANRQRALSEQRQHAERAVAAARGRARPACGRRAGSAATSSWPSRPTAPAGLELDVDYVVGGAGWSPVYDVRVDADAATVELTWAAQVRQASGEDWPACPLTVASSRPSARHGHPRARPVVDRHVGAAAPAPARRPRHGQAGERDADAMAGGSAPAPAPRPAFELAAEITVAEVVDTAPGAPPGSCPGRSPCPATGRRTA